MTSLAHLDAIGANEFVARLWRTTSAALQDVRPGKARVIKCLMENMAQPNFGEECRAELAKRQQVVKNDYRCGWHVGLAVC